MSKPSVLAEAGNRPERERILVRWCACATAVIWMRHALGGLFIAAGRAHIYRVDGCLMSARALSKGAEFLSTIGQVASGLVRWVEDIK